MLMLAHYGVEHIDPWDIYTVLLVIGAFILCTAVYVSSKRPMDNDDDPRFDDPDHPSIPEDDR